jgi:hypothetical protein
MNTDFGLFNLVVAIRSNRNSGNRAQTQEPCCQDESRLPEIDYFLLSGTPIRPDRPEQLSAGPQIESAFEWPACFS